MRANKKRKLKEESHVHSGNGAELGNEFEEEDISAFGLPIDFGSKKNGGK